MLEARGAERAELFLRSRLPWEGIDEVRRVVASFCASTAPVADRSAQVSLAVHELLENAVAHGRGDDVVLSVRIGDGGSPIRISVSNACGAEAAEALRLRLAEISASPDPLQLYVQTMRDSVESEGGGLGLARIRYESNLVLEARYDGARVTVLASDEVGGCHA